ncbi:hypothetical protein, partial [Bifidobacterium boum]|uniref:hypothetical protein n=1 Tax=Actinomycetota TaxID=201174 RepID=UPI003F9184D6
MSMSLIGGQHFRPDPQSGADHGREDDDDGHDDVEHDAAGHDAPPSAAKSIPAARIGSVSVAKWGV